MRSPGDADGSSGAVVAGVRCRGLVGVAVGAALALTAGPASAQRADQFSNSVREFISVDAPRIVIDNVSLVDGTGAPARQNMRVVLEGERIVEVEPASGAIPEARDQQYIDGAGMTLTPGWVMLHEHMFYPSGGRRYNTNEISFPPLYLAGGVTTLRTGGSMDPYTDLRIRQRVDAGRQPGPRMDITGPYLEGEGGFVLALPELRTPAEARAHVNFWIDRGVTSFKAYNLLDRATLGAAIEAAHARGIKVTGHLCSITYREAADLGIDNLEHGFLAATDWVPGKEPDECVGGANQSYMELDLDGPAFRGLVDHLVDNQVAITSTMTVFEQRGSGRAPVHPDALASIAEDRRSGVARVSERRAAGGGDTPGDELLRRGMRMEKIFHDAGGLLVVGTDPTGAGDVVPGYANLRALELLVEGGFTFEEAVKIATLNGATYLERADDLGTIAVGKRADLVLIAGNPTAEVSAVNNVVTVFKDGIGWDSAALFASVRGSVGIR